MNLGDLNGIVSAKELEDILYEAQMMALEAEEYLQYDGLSENDYNARKSGLSIYYKRVDALREYIRAQLRKGGET